MPGILWASSSDQTGLYPGLRCVRVETPVPNSPSERGWATFWKITRLIESLPF